VVEIAAAAETTAVVGFAQPFGAVVAATGLAAAGAFAVETELAAAAGVGLAEAMVALSVVAPHGSLAVVLCRSRRLAAAPLVRADLVSHARFSSTIVRGPHKHFSTNLVPNHSRSANSHESGNLNPKTFALGAPGRSLAP